MNRYEVDENEWSRQSIARNFEKLRAFPEAKRSELRVVLLEPTSKNLFGSIEIIFTLDYYYFICLKSDTLQLPDLTSYI